MATYRPEAPRQPFTYHSARWCPVGTSTPEGKRRERFTAYGDAGQKVSEGEFLNGKMHGLWTRWYPNGAKEAEASFLNGTRVDSFTTWHHNGSVAVTGGFLDGRPEGTWVYKNVIGRTVKKVLWQSGRLISVEEFD